MPCRLGGFAQGAGAIPLCGRDARAQAVVVAPPLGPHAGAHERWVAAKQHVIRTRAVRAATIALGIPRVMEPEPEPEVGAGLDGAPLSPRRPDDVTGDRQPRSRHRGGGGVSVSSEQQVTLEVQDATKEVLCLGIYLESLASGDSLHERKLATMVVELDALHRRVAREDVSGAQTAAESIPVSMLPLQSRRVTDRQLQRFSQGCGNSSVCRSSDSSLGLADWPAG
jgi:hypothetical protein